MLPKEKLHIPVLLNELTALWNQRQTPKRILDCTFGRGGHSLALLKAFPLACITAIDCDDQAIQYGLSLKEIHSGKINLQRGNFHQLPETLKEKEIYDMILIDLGVSSPQLDEKERGFSFYQNGPLDMRMDKSLNFTAEDIINSWNQKELIQLFQNYGEIKKPNKGVMEIIKQRRKKKIQTTFDLSQIIQKYHSHKMGKKHPATTWFLALRMAVNQELEGLSNCLPCFIPLLKEQAYLAVISFHSLEDRIVKKTFRQFAFEGKGSLWNKKVIRPGFEETRGNPRSRSAKMRVFQKHNQFNLS